MVSGQRKNAKLSSINFQIGKLCGVEPCGLRAESGRPREIDKRLLSKLWKFGV